MNNNRMPGYAGKMLRVDLNRGSFKEEQPDEATLRKYVGGTCLGTKYLYEEVSPGIKWSDPANKVIIATGPLSGTRMNGSGTFALVTKGAMTNGATSTQANGYMGAYMKFAGFDGVILENASPKWVYLYLHDGVAELKDASALKGKDTWETAEAIQKELGKSEREISVFSIGPAGENLVRFACLAGDRGHVAAHNGIGAVLGSKKIKAIVAGRGDGTFAVHDKDGVSAAAKDIMDRIKATAGGKAAFEWGTLLGFETLTPVGILPLRNYTTSVFADQDKFARFAGKYIRDSFSEKRGPCWACQQHHCDVFKFREGPYAGQIGEEPEYECLAAWGAVTGPNEVADAIHISWLNDRLGMDCNEAGWVIGLVQECYEKGILTKKQTEGLEMTWGNAPAIEAMLGKIARREGFGNALADGVRQAAQAIGGDAPNMAVYTLKGNTPRSHDHRALWFEFLDTVVSSAGTIESSFSITPPNLGFLGVKPDFSAFSSNPDDVVDVGTKIKGTAQFEDSAGVCRFNVRNNVPQLCQALSAATGWDFTTEESMLVGRRAVNLMKAFNLRGGMGQELDMPSPRYGSVPVDGPAKGRDIMLHWDKMRRDYYERMGWDRQTSKPLPETLKKLGLDFVVADLWGKR
ncbi:MAG: aldehyde ferredoxin oxidoreductase C-terminal domain-containing protein [Dehalococcoidales bacterium]|nr:aldehyde ferredoxin oxidoreductase C-terminal domain-containing protein [Dehalococcoidales bacterium]